MFGENIEFVAGTQSPVVIAAGGGLPAGKRAVKLGGGVRDGLVGEGEGVVQHR